ncbi:hypothetical protein TELCIR_13069 [Teladorsagia circumcincta]|uniref:Late embryogeneis abundant protein n=1 Tax=Teladorsagia circumcincta TaxID=45464 RepID=A0A2G9U4R6_TELCI|nr:hypothetical protein TELCIR_13069 [Teladorsagia circumcincta]
MLGIFQKSNHLPTNAYKMSHDSGVLADVGHKAQELKDVTAEKMCDAGAAVRDTLASGYEKVKDTVASGYEKVAGYTKETADQAGQKVEENKDAAADKANDARDYVGKKMHEGANKMQS